MRTVLFIVSSILFFSVGFGAQAQESSSLATKVEDGTDLTTQVGQLFLLGFQGTTLTPTMKRTIREIRPGGFILFKRNISGPTQLARLTYAIRKEFADQKLPPPFLAVDQEGGRVLRLNFGVPMPSASAMGATNDPELLESFGEETGRLLRGFGINMNLAPVVDVGAKSGYSFIDTRAFSDSPSLVAESATWFVRGQENARVISTLKHFPGHGGGIQDSHSEAAISDASVNELTERDLLPYRAVNKLFPLPAVLIGHIALPRVDKSREPATYSRFLLSEFGRKLFGPDTIFVTDDLNMAGAGGSSRANSPRAISAGADLLMITWSLPLQKAARDAVVGALSSGSLDIARVRESYSRILATKNRYGLSETLIPPTTLEISTLIQGSELNNLTRDTMRTLFRRSTKQISRSKLHPRISESLWVFSPTPNFSKNLARGAPNLKLRLVNRVDEFRSSDTQTLGVVYAAGRNILNDLNRLDSQTRSRLLVVNTHTPGALPRRSEYLGVFDLHSPFVQSGYWVGRFLSRVQKDPSYTNKGEY